ncbi:hypothetical protein A8F35_23040 [Burkholderia cenocepacia]|nr:hypothetical protein A8F35_23040 [Burkholderia cenocepacia]
MEDAAYHLAASSQSVRHSVRRAIHRRHQLRSFNRPQHTKFLTRPMQDIDTGNPTSVLPCRCRLTPAR